MEIPEEHPPDPPQVGITAPKGAEKPPKKGSGKPGAGIQYVQPYNAILSAMQLGPTTLMQLASLAFNAGAATSDTY